MVDKVNVYEIMNGMDRDRLFTISSSTQTRGHQRKLRGGRLKKIAHCTLQNDMHVRSPEISQ